MDTIRIGDIYTKICAEFSTPVTADTFCRRFDAAEAIARARETGCEMFWVSTVDSRGNSLFPTQYGLPHPYLKGRHYVRELTEAAHAAGMKITGYYNVDNPRVAEAHPEWSELTPRSLEAAAPDLARFPRLCGNGPGFREVFLPQLAEIAAFGTDGLFFDFLFPVRACFCEACRSRYRQDTGRELPWTDHTDEWMRYKEWIASCGRAWREAAANAVHAVNPAILVAVNNGYSTSRPEPIPPHQGYVTKDVDEKTAPGPLGTSREGRYMATLGAPYEIMTTGMQGWWGHWALKPVIQMQQEAATALAVGASTHIGIPTYRDGTIEPRTLKHVAETFTFIKQRAPFCAGAEVVADVAILHTSTSQRRTTDNIWEGSHPGLRGAAKALRDTQVHFVVINEWTFLQRPDRYALLVLPEQGWLSDEVVSALRDYVRQGGRILATGQTSLGNGPRLALADVFGVTDLGPGEGGPWYVRVTDPRWLADPALDAPLMMPGRPAVRIKAESAQTLGTLLPPRIGSAFHLMEPGDDQGWSGIVLNAFGKGAALYIPAPLFEAFNALNIVALRRLARAAIDTIFPDRMVGVRYPGSIEVSLLKQSSRYVLHLVNQYVEMTYQRFPAVEHLPELHDIDIELRLDADIKTIVQQPEGLPIPFERADGVVRFRIPRLHVHTCVVAET